MRQRSTSLDQMGSSSVGLRMPASTASLSGWWSSLAAAPSWSGAVWHGKGLEVYTWCWDQWIQTNTLISWMTSFWKQSQICGFSMHTLMSCFNKTMTQNTCQRRQKHGWKAIALRLCNGWGSRQTWTQLNTSGTISNCDFHSIVQLQSPGMNCSRDVKLNGKQSLQRHVGY